MTPQLTHPPFRLSISGMHCAGCAASARAKLAAVPGVGSAAVDFASGIAVITASDALPLDERAVRAAIRAAGFEPGDESEAQGLNGRLDAITALIALQTDSRERQRARLRGWSQSTAVAGSIWIVLEILHWTVAHSSHASHASHARGWSGWSGWIMFAGASIALVVAGRGFYASAWRAARRRTTNMDTLVVVGVTAAYALSVWNFFAGGVDGAPTYFAEACALLAIISLGHWIESRAARRANSAIEELLQLQPEFAERVGESATLTRVAVSELAVGDCVQVRPGARIPVDGIVVTGHASIDESSLTGEPLAVARTSGERVSAGTIALDGAIVVRATAVGSDSALGRIAQMVWSAQISEAPIARMADRVCVVFVPAVLLIALATFFAWWWMASLAIATVTAVTVLVISCPCALGIATPLALVVGTGEASRRGILVRNAAILQSVAAIRTVAFDKTGTITRGRPVLERIELVETSMSESRALALAAAAEVQSEHPLGRAIVAAAHAAKLALPVATNFRAQAGRGVQVECEGTLIAVVRDDAASARLEVDGVLLARFFIADEVRPQSREAVSQLRALGCGVALVTGDRLVAAQKIAHEVSMVESEVFAEQTPESKVAVITALRRDSLMMVGDGINDAAALACASVGVAMGSATALAVESADVILLRDDPQDVARLIGVARETFAVVRQNLFLAFAYNVLAIPAAACGLLGTQGPLIAAIAMGLSDLSVVGNTLWLRRRLRRGRTCASSGTPSTSHR